MRALQERVCGCTVQVVAARRARTQCVSYIVTCHLPVLAAHVYTFCVFDREGPFASVPLWPIFLPEHAFTAFVPAKAPRPTALLLSAPAPPRMPLSPLAAAIALFLLSPSPSPAAAALPLTSIADPLDPPPNIFDPRVFNAFFYSSTYPDLPHDASQVAAHWQTYGLKEGRQACGAFHVLQCLPPPLTSTPLLCP